MRCCGNLNEDFNMPEGDWRQSEQFQAHLRALAKRAEAHKAVIGLRAKLPNETDNTSLYLQLGKQLEVLGRDDEAQAVFENGCDLAPSVDLYLAYIDFLSERNETETAIRLANRGLARFPGNLLLRLKEACTLPVLYRSSEEISLYRERLSTRFQKIEATLDLGSADRKADALAAVCGHTNFYLGYQMDDVREFQIRYAAFVHKIIGLIHPTLIRPVPMQPDWMDRRIRIGFVSTQFNSRGHVVERLFGGWIANIDQQRFETYFYNPRRSADTVPATVPLGCENYRHVPGDLPSAAMRILADKLDVLIFVDIGMSRRITPLSCMRLAPIQCATWGHPITSGSPSLDYFISSALMEPANGDNHYSEYLIRLPGFGVHYPRPAIPFESLNATRTYFGLREDAIVYLCSQSFFKYVPAHDDLYPLIARRVPSAQFVFLTSNSAVKAAFKERLSRAFSAFGLDAASYCVFLPKVSTYDFWALNMTSNVSLDSLEWSGFNTTIDAIACGLPVVTLPGRFMRGRHSFAILSRMGVTETIAANKTEYVEIAALLGMDSKWRTLIVQKMSSREALIYEDSNCIRGLEDILIEAIHERSQCT
jgi:protein O-GlcNAc transferase